ncbi:tripartite tricarboxylate transporter substrate binding protein [Variovorax sp. LjRoot290]|uniref:Bug family tripartite tricarboxylate transporter substrate binding protein n=1 Tax=Variovorax sp. LjRoot290 TaxID=3342316 RepID=UPI003ED12A54
MQRNQTFPTPSDAETLKTGDKLLKKVLFQLAFAFALLVPALSASAQTYPSKLVTIRVPFPAGGPADAGFRQLQPGLQAQLGQTVVVDNLPGAGGSIGVMKVLSLPADGYNVVGHTASDLILAPLALATAKYDPGQLRLVSPMLSTDFVLVSSPRFSFKGVDDLLVYAQQPGNKELSIAHWGRGSTTHIAGADFQNRGNVRFLEVPYKGVAPIIPDLIGGQVDLTFLPLAGPTMGLIKSGKVIPIGVSAAKRVADLPDVPTLNEGKVIKGFEHQIWTGVFVDRKVGNAEVIKLAQAINAVTRLPEFAKFAADQAGRTFDPMTPAQADEYFKAETKRLTDIARLIKLQPE